MFAGWIFTLYCLCVSFKLTATQDECSPVYVRWARVRLNLTARVEGPYTLDNCTRSCTNGNNPARPGFPIECSGFNHKQGANSLSHDCQLFQREQLQNIDGHIEADDRYSFFWKYCAKTRKICKSAYQFDFYIDRYMDSSEIQRTINTDKVEDCLSRCLDETSFTCRSISFNRTASVCSLSSQSQISKPGYLRVNNNPNYRIDYYENNCFNESFTFHHDCRDNGVVVSVESKFSYTGALYGLYDFFTCRIEPKNETRFSLFFPYAFYSKNCTDSFSQKENNNVLDVVLSTDGLEPLYFLTDQDLLYQAKCPINSFNILPPPSTIGATVVFLAPQITTTTTTTTASTASTSVTSSPSTTTNSTDSSVVSISDALSTVPFSSISTKLSTTTDMYSSSVTYWEKETSIFGKKSVVTLPVVDFTPKMEKVDSGDSFLPSKGNKITVVVKYTDSSDLFHEPDDFWAQSLPQFNTSKYTTIDEISQSTNGGIKATSTNTESSIISTSANSTPISTSTTTSSTSTTTSSSSTSTTTSTSASTKRTSPTSTTSSTTTTTTIPTTTSTTKKTTTFTTTTTTERPTTKSTTELATASVAKVGKEYTNINPQLIIESNIETKNEERADKSTSAPAVLSSTQFPSTLSTSQLSTSRKKTETPISTRSTTSTSTSTATTTSLETIKPTQTIPTTTTEPTTTTRTTTITNDTTTEQFFSRFDPFGPNRQSATPSSSTTSLTTTTSQASTKKFAVETNLDSSTSTSQNTPKSTTSELATKSFVTNVTTTLSSITTTLPSTTTAPQKILFDIFHNGQPVSAVVVGSRITLSFSSGLGIPAPYVTLIGCQVEPVNSPYAWERDPLQIVKNGCQADGVGLVCPPTRTDFGVKVEMEAFRYTTTSEVLYSCLVRICAFNQCPQPFCNAVDGCESSNTAVPVIINSRGRRKRQQIQPPFFPPAAPSFQIPGAFQQSLLGSAGDIVVSKKLVVVNSENELQYYLRTGNVPTGGNFNSFAGR